MRNTIKRFLNSYFGESLDLSVQVFHLLGFIGVALGFFNALNEVLTDWTSWHIVLNLASSFFALFLIYIAKRTGRYRFCFLITVIVVFLVVFPVLFFTGNGYRGTLPMFFALAFIFTTLMLDRWQRVFFLAAELAVYTACFFVEHYMFGQLANFDTNMENLFDILTGFLGVGCTLTIIVALYIRIHNRQRRKLDEQNAALAEANRAKTEFLQDIGHEIRNPLQVISYGIDFMRNCIDAESGAEEMPGALAAIQDEAMRLGLMINGMVELAVMSGSLASRTRLDFADMLRRRAETARQGVEGKRNTLRVEIAPDLPHVYAVPEQLERVPVNLLQNAVNATEDGEISLAATLDGNYITVKIRDNGTGISAELLPRVFERGVSGKGGKGYGLSICKTIIEAHGGAVAIESEPGKGTTVTFTVPVYGGQSEVSA